jgi:hypothetical protein
VKPEVTKTPVIGRLEKFSHRAVMDVINTKNGKELPKSEKSKGSGAGIFYMK